MDKSVTVLNIDNCIIIKGGRSSTSMSPTRDNSRENELKMDLHGYTDPVPTTASREIEKDEGFEEKAVHGQPKPEYEMAVASKPPAIEATSSGMDICKFNIGGDSKRPKYATVRSFQGKVYDDIREFYGSGGLFFPTKKGITLPASSFKSLLTVTKKINAGIYRGEQLVKKRQ